MSGLRRVLLVLLVATPIGGAFSCREDSSERRRLGDVQAAPSEPSAQDKPAVPETPIGDPWLRKVPKEAKHRPSAVAASNAESDSAHSGALLDKQMSVALVVDCKGVELDKAGRQESLLRGLGEWLTSAAAEGRIGLFTVNGVHKRTALPLDSTGTVVTPLDLSLAALTSTEYCPRDGTMTLDAAVDAGRRSLAGKHPRLLIVVTDRLTLTSADRDPLALDPNRSDVAAAWFSIVSSDRRGPEGWVYFRFPNSPATGDAPQFSRGRLDSMCGPSSHLEAKGSPWRSRPADHWYYWYEGPRPVAMFVLLELSDRRIGPSATELAELDRQIGRFLSSGTGQTLAQADAEIGSGALFFRLFPAPAAPVECEERKGEASELGVSGNVAVRGDDRTCSVVCERASGMLASSFGPHFSHYCGDGFAVYAEGVPPADLSDCPETNRGMRYVVRETTGETSSLKLDQKGIPAGVFSESGDRTLIDCSAYFRWLRAHSEEPTSFTAELETPALRIAQTQLPASLADKFSAPVEDEANAPCRIAGLTDYLDRLVRFHVGLSDAAAAQGVRPEIQPLQPLVLRVSAQLEGD